MLFALNVAGLFIFIGIAIFFSRDRSKINKKTVSTLLILNFIIAAFVTVSPIGRELIISVSGVLNSIVATELLQLFWQEYFALLFQLAQA